MLRPEAVRLVPLQVMELAAPQAVNSPSFGLCPLNVLPMLDSVIVGLVEVAVNLYQTSYRTVPEQAPVKSGVAPNTDRLVRQPDNNVAPLQVLLCAKTERKGKRNRHSKNNMPNCSSFM